MTDGYECAGWIGPERELRVSPPSDAGMEWEPVYPMCNTWRRSLACDRARGHQGPHTWERELSAPAEPMAAQS